MKKKNPATPARSAVNAARALMKDRAETYNALRQAADADNLLVPEAALEHAEWELESATANYVFLMDDFKRGLVREREAELRRGPSLPRVRRAARA